MHPKLQIVTHPTPLEKNGYLSRHLGIDLYVKRDDLAGPTFGGNKSRQLEYYFGAAKAEKADTILITGAVQSNFARLAAAVANKNGMQAIVQLEDRVKGKPNQYKASGNVLLSGILGAEIIHYPEGEDEEGADAALRQKAETLAAEGRRPYIIHLSEQHPPLGALGYVDAANEVLEQSDDFDFYVVASGSGSTHAGLLAGLRAVGSKAIAIGSCVRRPAAQQGPRIRRVIDRLTLLFPDAKAVSDNDIVVWDRALAPGYGNLGENSLNAIKLMARMEGLHLDPVYTAKSFAAVMTLVETGEIPKGSRVCFVHTGGLAALFAYQQDIEGSF